MGLKKFFWGMMVFAALLVAGGCDPQGEKAGPAPSASSSPSSAAASSGSSASSGAAAPAPKAEKKKELVMKLYYPNEDGMRLVAVSRKVEVPDEAGKYAAALQSLMQGTKERGTSMIIPRQAKLKSVKLQDGVAVVDFSGDLGKHFVGGSTGEEMLVGSVVNTLTEFPEVKSVRILIDGQTVETLAGHMDLSVPIQRMESILPK